MVGLRNERKHCARQNCVLAVLLLAAPLATVAGPAPETKSVEASIPFANQGGIRDWRADGTKGMWLEAAGGHWYYASFSSQCTSLPFATGVRFVPEPSGVLSRWSSIRLSHNERCFFRNLQRSERPPKKVSRATHDATGTSS
jgi:hypothetical protein